ncbi:uncharacterized protein [Argopecten irradians]|uniref:uncharacterized protein n=1 Tax=Argopecten irradians TaxID=31199 RepID=UPI003723B4C2
MDNIKPRPGPSTEKQTGISDTAEHVQHIDNPKDLESALQSFEGTNEFAEQLQSNCLKHDLQFKDDTTCFGNCFFEVVSRQLQRFSDVSVLATELRKKMVVYLERDPTLMSPNGKKFKLSEYVDSDYEIYCKNLASNVWFADHVVVFAMAYMLQMRIYIITPSTQPNNAIVCTPGQNEDKGTLYMGHFWKSHYISLIHAPHELASGVKMTVVTKSHAEGIDPQTVEKVIYNGKYKSLNELDYICKDYGLQLRQTAENGNGNCNFFEAVCDQLTRLDKKASILGQNHDPRSLRNEFLNFLSEDKNMIYQTSSKEVNLRKYLPANEIFEEWSKKMRDENCPVDFVVIIALAIFKRRNIVLLTAYTSKQDDNMMVIPAIVGKSFDINDSILLGYYGEQDQNGKRDLNDKPENIGKFESLESIFKLAMGPGSDAREIPGISLCLYDKDQSKESHVVDVHKELIPKSSRKLSHSLALGRKEYGLMTIIQNGKHKEIKSNEIMTKQEKQDTDKALFPSPVVSFEPKEGKLDIKWRWHNDKRHVVTTIMVVGMKFIERSGMQWCVSTIVEEGERVNVKQYMWQHRRQDNQVCQTIDCLIPCVTYRIFVVDHFQKILHSDIIERTISDVMHYTPSPWPLHLRVFDNNKDEQFGFEWCLKDEICFKYISSLELCLKDDKNEIRWDIDWKTIQERSQRFIILKNIKKNIKIKVKVKTKIIGDVGQLSDTLDVVIVHPPKPSAPEREEGVALKKPKKGIKHVMEEDNETKSSPPLASTIQKIRHKAVYDIHKLKCGALTCHRSSGRIDSSQERPASLPERPATPSERPATPPEQMASPQEQPALPPEQPASPPEQPASPPKGTESPPPITWPVHTNRFQDVHRFQNEDDVTQQEGTGKQRHVDQDRIREIERKIEEEESKRNKTDMQSKIEKQMLIEMEKKLEEAEKKRLETEQQVKEEKRKQNEKKKQLEKEEREIRKKKEKLEKEKKKLDQVKIKIAEENSIRIAKEEQLAQEKNKRKEKEKRLEEETKKRIEKEKRLERERERLKDKEKQIDKEAMKRKELERKRDEEERKHREKQQRREEEEMKRRLKEKLRKDEEESRRRDKRRREYEEELRMEFDRIREEEEWHRKSLEMYRQEKEKRRRERQREKEEDRRHEDLLRRFSLEMYQPPKHTTIESPRKKSSGYFRILWKRPVQDNNAMMYLSPYT